MRQHRTDSNRRRGRRAPRLLLALASVASALVLLFASGLALPTAPRPTKAKPAMVSAPEGSTEAALALDAGPVERSAGGDATEPASVRSGTGKRELRGRVTSDAGPIADAAVVLVLTRKEPATGAEERSRERARTDAQGAFRFANVPPDATLLLQAAHPGFVPLVQRVEGDAAGEIDLHLAPDPRPRVRVAGEVVLPDGTAAAGATVRYAKHSVRTDARGAYTLELLDLGAPATALTAELEGRVQGRLEHFGARLAVSGPAETTDTRSITGVRIVLGEKALAIAGRVLDSDGRPAKGWRVAVEDDADRRAAARTDRDGRFVLPGLAGGQHVLRAWCRAPEDGFVSDPIEAGARDVELAPRR